MVWIVVPRNDPVFDYRVVGFTNQRDAEQWRRLHKTDSFDLDVIFASIDGEQELKCLKNPTRLWEVRTYSSTMNYSDDIKYTAYEFQDEHKPEDWVDGIVPQVGVVATPKLGDNDARSSYYKMQGYGKDFYTLVEANSEQEAVDKAKLLLEEPAKNDHIRALAATIAYFQERLNNAL